MLNKTCTGGLVAEPRALRFADRLLGVGVTWMIFGLAIAPSQKLYFQLLIPLLYLPALCLIAFSGRSFAQLLRESMELKLFLLLILWAGISMTWSVGIDVDRESRRLLFILLFVVGGALWGRRDPERTVRILFLSGMALAVCALLAMVLWPWRTPEYVNRMTAFCTLNHPIFAGYAMGAAAVWLVSCVPSGRLNKGLWLAAILVLMLFVVLTWSRGALMALALCMVLMPLLNRHRYSKWCSLTALVGAGVVALEFSGHLMERGVSYRPEIFRGALEKIAQHPWLGVGKATDYSIVAAGRTWPHSHNLFTHTAIELGVVAMFVLLILWGLILLRGWRNRHMPLGRALIGLWIFSTVALQFDGPKLWESPGPFWLLTWLPLMLSLVLCGTSVSQREQV